MKPRIVKKILLFSAFFILGFLTHAFFFPDFLINGFSDISNIAIPDISPTPGQDVNSTFFTKITYNDSHFSRHSLVIPISSYVMIENMSTTSRMWLLSNNPLLATQRGYSYTEAIRVRLDNRGSFVVEDKSNPQEKILITVK